MHINTSYYLSFCHLLLSHSWKTTLNYSKFPARKTERKLLNSRIRLYPLLRVMRRAWRADVWTNNCVFCAMPLLFPVYWRSSILAFIFVLNSIIMQPWPAHKVIYCTWPTCMTLQNPVSSIPVPESHIFHIFISSLELISSQRFGQRTKAPLFFLVCSKTFKYQLSWLSHAARSHGGRLSASII